MTTDQSPVLWIIDGSSFVFRAHHAMPGLRNRAGNATGAVYGFVSMMNALIEEESPQALVVAFDTGEPTFREEAFPDYKANREEVPRELCDQFPLVRKWLDAAGIVWLEAPGFEADDLIGTLARMAEEEGRETRILTGDKDLLQLATERALVVRDTQGGRKVYDREGVRERYRVDPERFPDVLGLVGDASDNIPGVPMIGEKTAIILIEKYGSLEGLYEKADEIGGKRGQSLRDSKTKAFLSRELATVRKDVPMPIGIADLGRRPANLDSLRALYEDLGFSSLLRKMDQGRAPSQEEEDYRIVDSVEGLAALVEELVAAGRFAVDTETTSLQPRSADLVGISVSWAPGAAAYIPVGHLEGRQIPLKEVRRLLGPVLADPEIGKVGHHLKYDLQVLRRAGFELAGADFDTLLAGLLVETTGVSLSLDSLSRKHTNKPKHASEALFGRGKTIDMASIESAADYACRDAEATLLLGRHYGPLLEKDPNRRLFREVEMPLSDVLAEMEWTGVRVLPEVLERQSLELGEMADRLAESIYEEVGERFNLNSTKQLSEILYDRLGLLRGRKRSTRAEVLERLAKEGHTFAESVLEYRHLRKLKSTYLDALPQLVCPETGRVHTSYSQTRAATGRISSSDPNLQNIPIRTEWGKRVREAFVPEAGYLFLSADYSQIELRIVAHYSGDRGLTAAFEQGEDIHRRTAAEIFGVSIQEVTPDQRNKAKAINFGLHYGMTEHGLADRLDIAADEARDYMRLYFERYPSVEEHIQRTIREASEKGYVTTLLDRKIHIPDLRSPNGNVVQNARRAAINAPIQGTAAEMLKLAMIRLAGSLRKEGLGSRMILTVHDEVIVETVESELEAVRELTVREMERALPLRVPVRVNVKTGADWASLE